VHITAPTAVRGVKPEPRAVTCWPSRRPLAGLTVTGNILVPSPSIGLPAGSGRAPTGGDGVGDGPSLTERVGRTTRPHARTTSAATVAATSQTCRPRRGPVVGDSAT
jgi:hypothetical protein